MNPLQNLIYACLIITLAIVGCKSPSGRMDSDTISIQLSISDREATIWLLSPSGTVISDTTLAGNSANFEFEKGMQATFIIHKPGFQTHLADFKASRDSTIALTMIPVLQHKEISLLRRLANGTIQNVTSAVADLTVRGIHVETVTLQSTSNAHSIPVIHIASFNAILHSEGCDSATVAFASSEPAVTSVTLNYYPFENLTLQVWEYMTTTKFLHNTATITEKKSGLVAKYDPINHVYRMSPRIMHKPFDFAVTVPNYKKITQVDISPVIIFMMQNEDSPLIELFNISEGDRWAFEHNVGSTAPRFEQFVFTNKSVVGNEIHYEVRVDELSRTISGSDITWSVLSSATGTIIETESGFWIDSITNPVLTFKSIPTYSGSSNKVILTSGVERNYMPLPHRLTRKVPQTIKEVHVVSFLAGGPSYGMQYDQTGLTQWSSLSGGGNSGFSRRTIKRIPAPDLD
jgi:hypothetical protein